MYDIRPFIASVRAIVSTHRCGAPGAYRRWNWQDARAARDLSLNPYGCADAANILYTIGEFPREPSERSCWINTLRSLQDAATGMWREATHHEIHTTAHCIAALELLDAGPLRPLTALEPLRNPAAMERFLDRLDWRNDPWSQSHRGAGLYAALVLSRAVDDAWEDRYFSWLWNETDPATGFPRTRCVAPVAAGGTHSLFPHLAGTFHYLFCQEYARRPLRHPAAVIDTCLELRRAGAFPLGSAVGFAEVDWVYCLNRASRQSTHRHDECRAALMSFAHDYIGFLAGLDGPTHDGLNDLHMLFGAVCCLAELQAALPGMIRTSMPLKLVLDRRPFI